MLLRTPRLVLREYSADDLPAMLAYRRGPAFERYYPPGRASEGATAALLERFLGWREEEPRSRYQLAVALAGSGELIGSVGLRMPAPEARVAETGFELDSAHWGKGYATEAARALLDHGFASLGLHRVHAHCIAENQASARVLERLGMIREGRLREHEYFGGRWWDVLLYGVLASEWEGPSPGHRAPTAPDAC